MNRRDILRMAVGGAAALACAPTIDARAGDFGGIRLGAISYSFRSLPRPDDDDPTDLIIDALRSCGLTLAELTNFDVERGPRLALGGRVPSVITDEYRQQRAELRAWRLATPLAFYERIGHRYRKAGIELLSYAITFSDDFTDEEISKSMQATRALGARIVGTNQTRVPMAPRLVAPAGRHGVRVAFHNHSNVRDPDEVGSVASLEKLFAISRRFFVNLDLGHFVAGNNDPLAFLRQHHRRVSHLHLKDRGRDDGPNRPWGEAATPLRDVLRLVRDERWAMPCMVEYEYPGSAPAIEEVRRCIEFVREALR